MPPHSSDDPGASALASPQRRTAMRCHQLVAFGEGLQAQTQRVPEPTGTEVLVRVLAAGVCHSDLHLVDGFYDLGSGRRLSFTGRIDLPITPGHETAGQVAAMGPDATGVVIGQACLVCSWIGCGSCEACRAGDEQLCADARTLGFKRDGGYADYVVVPHPRYLIDIGNMDPAAAAPLVCAGLTAFSAIRKLAALPDRAPIVLIGAGGLGLIALRILAMLGGRGAVVVEPDTARREAARAAGALACFDPADPGAMDHIRKAIPGPILGVIDFAGTGDTVALSIELLDRTGQLVVVGLIGGAASIPVPLLPLKALTIQGSYVGSPAELRQLVALVRDRGLLPMPIDRRPLAEADSALQDLRRGAVTGRIVLEPEGA